MSFLTGVSARRLTVTFAAAPRASIASAIVLQRQRSAFSTTPPRAKTATEAAKDTLKTIDRTVSDKLVDGIDAGSNVAGKMRDAAESLQSQASSKASELKGKASEIQGKASGKAAKIKGEATGKANEMASDAKEKADEVKKNL